MRIGAHVSTREPFSECITRAVDLGCECMQIFGNLPQRWGALNIKEEEIERYLELNSKSKIEPVVLHGIYLINLATNNPFFYESSIKSLIDDMQKAAKLRALGVNFHVGSTKGAKLSEVMTKIVLAIKDILAAVPEGPYLILENSSGSGDIIGDKLEELAEIIREVKSDRLMVTIDTAHAFASGYNIATEDGLEDFLAKFDKLIGLEKLVCLHLNDSAVPWASQRDRHADIGDGYIGLEAFRRIINHPCLRGLPGIVETPGNKGKTDVDNLKILKDLRR